MSDAVRGVVPKLALSAAFFAYAAFADFGQGFLRQVEQNPSQLPRSVAAYLNGLAASQIDALYKSVLPHRSVSIDVMGALRYLAFKEGQPGVVVGRDGWLFTSEEFRASGDQTAALKQAASGIAAIAESLAAAGRGS